MPVSSPCGLTELRPRGYGRSMRRHRQPGWGGPPSWLPTVPLAVLAAVIQVGGSWGRAQRDGTSLGWVAVLLLLVGPVAIVTLARFPLVPLSVAITASVAYTLLGNPVGPIVAAPLAALLLEGLRRRRERFAQVRRDRHTREDRARVDERMAMARDLHDALGHSLTLITVQAGAALHTFDREPENARRALLTVRSESQRALDEVRRVLDAVRDPGSAADRRPEPTLADVAALVAADPDVAWDLVVTGSDVEVPPAVGAAAYRVVQEAMTNVRRHSAADGARITLHRSAADLTVEVEDLGGGVGAAHSGEAGGTGLVGMRERVHGVGGRLSAGATGSGGFLVQAVFPLGRPGEGE